MSTDAGHEPLVEVSLEGGGLSFSRAVSETTALRILHLAITGAPGPSGHESPQAPNLPERPPPVGEQGGRAAAPSTDPRETVGEFVTRSGANRQVEKITAIAQYLKDTGVDRFTSDQVKNEFPRAGEKVPGNFSRDFRWAVQAKWIAVDPRSPKEYYITGTGTKAVESNFSQEVRKASQIRTGRRKSAASKTGDEA